VQLVYSPAFATLCASAALATWWSSTNLLNLMLELILAAHADGIFTFRFESIEARLTLYHELVGIHWEQLSIMGSYRGS
jgi:hypothetical protein